MMWCLTKHRDARVKNQEFYGPPRSIWTMEFTLHPRIVLQISLTRCTILLNVFISLLYMFRASMCPSSGGNYCIYATLVFVTLYGWRPVCWLEFHSNQHTRRPKHVEKWNKYSRIVHPVGLICKNSYSSVTDAKYFGHFSGFFLRRVDVPLICTSTFTSLLCTQKHSTCFFFCFLSCYSLHHNSSLMLLDWYGSDTCLC